MPDYTFNSLSINSYHKQDFNHDEDESSELSTIPDDSSFTDTDTTSDSDIEETNLNSFIPPPIPERQERKSKENVPLLHNETLPSVSDDSFPKGSPKRLPHTVRILENRPQSSSSSYPESIDTDSETEIPRSKGTRLHKKKHQKGKSKCPKAPPLNDNYITPVHSSEGTEDLSRSSLIRSDEAQDMNVRTSMGYHRSSSIMSNSSTDSFPSCPPSPLKVTKNRMPLLDMTKQTQFIVRL